MTEISSQWTEYAGDIFFIFLFLFVYIFFKPDANAVSFDEKLSEEEKPNPLEEVLVTEQADNKEDGIKNGKEK